MDGELRRDVQAFLTSLADECKICLHQRAAACGYCHASAARRILRRMAMSPSAENPALRCDIVARMARIAAILQHARRPLLSVEIDMKDFCSRSLKEFTLREMVRIGKVVRRRVRGSDKYRYSLSNKYLRSLQVHKSTPQSTSHTTSPHHSQKPTPPVHTTSKERN